jgi:hypothetical protein
MNDELLKQVLYSDVVSIKDKLQAIAVERPDILAELEAEIRAELGKPETLNQRMKRLAGLRGR